MLTHHECERLDEYFPPVTFWMRFHLIFWTTLTLAAVILVLLFVILGKAQASLPAWIILALAIFGVGALPIYLFFLQRKKRQEFRRRVVAVGFGVIYRTEGYDMRAETILLNDVIRPLAKKNLLPLVSGMLSPVTGPLPDLPEWVSITFHAQPYVEITWNDRRIKARGFCEDHKYLLISNPGSLESIQALLLHETAHAIITENFPKMEGPEQERIIKESRIEKTDLLGLA